MERALVRVTLIQVGDGAMAAPDSSTTWVCHGEHSMAAD